MKIYHKSLILVLFAILATNASSALDSRLEKSIAELNIDFTETGRAEAQKQLRIAHAASASDILEESANNRVSDSLLYAAFVMGGKLSPKSYDLVKKYAVGNEGNSVTKSIASYVLLTQPGGYTEIANALEDNNAKVDPEVLSYLCWWEENLAHEYELDTQSNDRIIKAIIVRANKIVRMKVDPSDKYSFRCFCFKSNLLSHIIESRIFKANTFLKSYRQLVSGAFLSLADFVEQPVAPSVFRETKAFFDAKCSDTISEIIQRFKEADSTERKFLTYGIYAANLRFNSQMDSLFSQSSDRDLEAFEQMLKKSANLRSPDIFKTLRDLKMTGGR